MGYCFSCCRRRKSPEREPLLRKDRVLRQPAPYDEIFSNVVAAINAGKLPSQAQLDHACRVALNSAVLEVKNDRNSGSGPLSDSLRQIVKDIREVIEASVELGLQKNADDKIQEIIFLSKDVSSRSVHTSVFMNITGENIKAEHVPNAASNIPSTTEFETDTKRLAGSVAKLLTLFVTSSTFCVLLQDVLVSMRGLLADTAATVSRTAGQVQITAEKLEHMIQPGNGSVHTQGNITSGIDEIEQNSADAFADLQNATADKARAIVIDRIQDAIARAHKSPEYNRAIQTIILVFRKYRERLNEITSTAKEVISSVDVRTKPQLWADGHLAIILTHIKSVLERFASNHSLDTVVYLFNVLVDDMTASVFDTGLESYFSDVGEWFGQALSDASYATSPEGKMEAEVLYDRGQTSAMTDTIFGKDIRRLAEALDSFFNALQSDRSSQRLLGSLDALSHDFASLYQTQPGQFVEELKRDAVGWFLPRVLRTLHTIPMPRIEFVDDTWEVALDAMFLTATSTVSSLMPDHILLENQNELYIDMNDGNIRKDRIRIHVDGLRFAARDLGYYFRYKGCIFGYTDEGFVSVFAGEEIGQGLTFDVDLELDAGMMGDGVEALFRIQGVQASITGLRFSINQSNHWIINKLLMQPFAGPIVRRIFENFISQYVRTVLDAAAQFAACVQKDARASVPECSSPSCENYWIAILRQSDSSQKEDETSLQPASLGTAVHTQATLKGIIRTSQENTDASVPHEAEETTFAIGIGPQILPNKGPVALGGETTQIARDTVEEVEYAVDNVKGKTRELVNGAENISSRYVVDSVTERIKERAEVERQGDGWRSSAFDLW